jgi:hypothetical protein
MLTIINNYWNTIKTIFRLYFKFTQLTFLELKEVIEVISKSEENIKDFHKLMLILLVIQLIFTFGIYPLIVLYGWNIIIVSLFGVPIIGYLWALLISFLINIILHRL